MFMKIKMI